VEKGEDLAPGDQEAPVDRVGGSLVGTGDQTQPVAIAPENLEGSVGRAAVHDDILDAGIVLSKYAADGFLNIQRQVIHRSDDAYQGRIRHRGSWNHYGSFERAGLPAVLG